VRQAFYLSPIADLCGGTQPLKIIAGAGKMSDEEAAKLLIAALTAWYSLVDFGQIQPGKTMLVMSTDGASISVGRHRGAC
jgi:NADPH:quinone reductase-like Zn-dependent oxidoreductase